MGTIEHKGDPVIFYRYVGTHLHFFPAGHGDKHGKVLVQIDRQVLLIGVEGHTGVPQEGLPVHHIGDGHFGQRSAQDSRIVIFAHHLALDGETYAPDGLLIRADVSPGGVSGLRVVHNNAVHPLRLVVVGEEPAPVIRHAVHPVFGAGSHTDGNRFFLVAVAHDQIQLHRIIEEIFAKRQLHFTPVALHRLQIQKVINGAHDARLSLLHRQV